MSDLYRLVYASKNLLVGSEDDVAAAVLQILHTSQRNNAKNGVTGALMFNGRAFAQVLEGPRLNLEATFERIQRDVRHSDVTVLQCSPVEARKLASWSMAFVGRSPEGQAKWNGLTVQSGFDMSRLDGDEVLAMLHGLVLEEEGAFAPSRPAAALSGPEEETPVSADRIRSEIDRIRPDSPTKRTLGKETPVPQSDAETVALLPHTTDAASVRLEAAEVTLSVLRAALAAERQRTTDLRNELDNLQAHFAISRSEHHGLRTQAALWATHARLLADAIVDETHTLAEANRNAGRHVVGQAA